jgi:hypothetical protein
MSPIEFHSTPGVLSKVPHPYPASRHVSDWFKEMPADYEGGATLKRCPPFLAAMTAGYLIPAPDDLHFTMSAEGVLTAEGASIYLSPHSPRQYKGSPFATSSVVKFHNPWIIVTPPEYVCLITAPINRFELPFLPLTGIVETGKYYMEVQLPMACMMRPGQTFDLARGTPLIQVIPVRREEWKSRIAPMDEALRERQFADFTSNPHTYKDEFWEKLQFE